MGRGGPARRPREPVDIDMGLGRWVSGYNDPARWPQWLAAQRRYRKEARSTMKPNDRADQPPTAGAEARDGDVAIYQQCHDADCPRRRDGYEHAHLLEVQRAEVADPQP